MSKFSDTLNPEDMKLQIDILTRTADLRKRGREKLRDITEEQWQSFQADNLKLLDLMIEFQKRKEDA